ncbi:MAG: hypothetical protein ACRECQ_16435, partial [Burkholderiaceae bacterium]
REVDITSRRTLLDLSGAPITEAAFADRFNVRVVPVVVLLDQKLQVLTEPLVGIDRAGFYESLLTNAIDTATKRLGRTR